MVLAKSTSTKPSKYRVDSVVPEVSMFTETDRKMGSQTTVYFLRMHTGLITEDEWPA